MTGRRGVDLALCAMAVALGLAGGLIEGIGHMVLQRLAVLENSWYSIIWISSIVNGLLVGLVALAVPPCLAWMRDRVRARRVAVFLVLLAACVPIVALMLKEWIQPYAIAFIALGLATTFVRWFERAPEASLRFWRRVLPWAATATLVSAIAIEGTAAANERIQTSRLPPARATDPHILLVVIDALRADHLSSYGYSRPTSTAIDRLATEGVVFENAMSTASYTLPSHASLVTGLYPADHGVDWNTSHGFARSRLPRLPLALQSLGYRTGAFSGNTFYFTREHGFGPGFLHFEDFFHSVPDMFWRTAYGAIATRFIRGRIGLKDLPGRKLATHTARAVERWALRDAERPYFAMINFMDVHDPYLPPQPFRSRFSGGGSPGGLLNFTTHVPASLTPAELQSEIDAYDGAIAYVDDTLGRLVNTLKAASPARDLVVIVTSDHGEEFGEHGGYLHARHLYRETIHVPLIIWAPGRVAAGRRVSRPVTNAAVPATVMSLLGGQAFAGPSLDTLWAAGSDQDWPLPAAELRHRPWAPSRDPVHEGSLWSVIGPRWHYIEQDNHKPQLFDWLADPRESTDLAERDDLHPVRRDLSALLAEHRKPKAE
jgi:arylsulfatase A-like enzyme